MKEYPFLGLIIGLVIGGIYNISLNGLFATIIHISNTNDRILYYLQHRDDKRSYPDNITVLG